MARETRSEKALLRSTLLERRKRIPASLRRRKSRRIFEKLSRIKIFQRAVHVAFYYGVPPEVETRTFFRKFLETKKIYLPKVNRGKKTLSFHRVRCLHGHLKKSFYGIAEPGERCVRRSAGRMDLILVPGVGFDRRGGRLGRGGGYYDHALRYAARVPKLGICFREQLVRKIPMGKHDVRMDQVITD